MVGGLVVWTTWAGILVVEVRQGLVRLELLNVGNIRRSYSLAVAVGTLLEELA